MTGQNWEEYRRSARHQLRTPVNHILSYGQLLRYDAEASGDEAQVAELIAIDDAGKEALTVISRMLDPQNDVALSLHRETIRGLMSTVTRSVDLLRDQISEEENPEACADLDKITGGADRLVEMVDEILTQVGTDLVPVDPPVSTSRLAMVTPEMIAAAQAAEGPVPGVAPGRVLVVDDNDAGREALIRMLERLGHTVVQAENGQRALDVLAAEPVDLVLLDVVMPVLDGYGVLAARQSRPALLDIPFVMTSALDEMASVVRCLEMGAQDYLSKPFEPVVLRARVNAWLEIQRLQRQVADLQTQLAAAQSPGASAQASS